MLHFSVKWVVLMNRLPPRVIAFLFGKKLLLMCIMQVVVITLILKQKKCQPTCGFPDSLHSQKQNFVDRSDGHFHCLCFLHVLLMLI